ncbi:Transcriptional Regulator, GntR family [Thiobacillus denitrificans ATCC 25259]|uniref:Transcriptional Regulator, GntR family n=1 Tax=Thiobacillus denitrificans (strain ATCC 25259 / T1) TaxID=292415 RepID=Q3SGJ6_THIDA|nr:phosphonate metabolism transcriptional regulator PhnF [Thiobacillus denitrificans]AAZ98254.1 Transcriptional Regulator, GntR family [Thiobacillus denitrificans ATCC 25259]
MSLVALQRNGGEAIYSQIAKLLKGEIASFLSPGACLPSENELAERFGVNRHTIRRAVEDLIAAGLLERRHGKGTFVLDAPADYVLGSGTRFTETFESLGKTASSRVLRKLVIPARGGVATRLRLAENDPVVWIESLRLADDRAICVISHFLPRQAFPDVLADYPGGSLHEHLAVRHGLKLRRIESLVSAALPQGDDASLLGMAQNQPVLRVKSVNVDERDGTPLEYALTRFRADRIQLRINP